MGATENNDTKSPEPLKEDTATQTEKRKSTKKNKDDSDHKKLGKEVSEKKARDKVKSNKENVVDELQSDNEDGEKGDLIQAQRELEEELDITIMKQKEYLFEKQFLWNGKVKWDIVKSDIFSAAQSDKLQNCVGKKAGYAGLLEALGEAEGAEDLADLAKVLQPTNPMLATELATELDLALGLTPVPYRAFRDAVKCTRTTFGRGGLDRDDENQVIRLLSQRMVYGAKVGEATVNDAQQQARKAKDEAEFRNYRVERLATELERILKKQGVDLPKQRKKSKAKQEDDLSAFKLLDAMLDQYFTYSEGQLQGTKKVADQRAKTVEKVLKRQGSVDDLCAAIEEALEERQAALREHPPEGEDTNNQGKDEVTEEEIRNLEKELARREKELQKERQAYRADELRDLKSRKANFKKDRDAIKASRKELKAEVQEQKQQLDFIKTKVERLEKVLCKVLKGAAY